MSRDNGKEKTIESRDILIDSTPLFNILSMLEDYELTITQKESTIILQALDYNRSSLLIHKVPFTKLTPPLKTPIKVYYYVKYGGKRIYIKDYIHTQKLKEPTHSLNTKILIDNKSFANLLRIYSWDEYSTVNIIPFNNHQIKLFFSSDESFELIVDKSMARLINGDESSAYKIKLILINLSILRRLGINRLVLAFSREAPLLMKPVSRNFPRIWIAPIINE